MKAQQCIPPEANKADFAWHMKDKLDVYHCPHDPLRPVVCLDETSRHVLANTRDPLPPVPGRPARHDSEYEHKGVVNCFLGSEPLRRWRHVRLSDRSTPIDWAHCVQELVNVHYPQAERIVLVMDQLNTRSPALLYEAFAPNEAKRLADRLEIHLHPQARLLAQHGRDRAKHRRAAAPQSATG